MDTVIDTNVFAHARDLHREYGMNCLLFLCNFMQCDDKMALDYQSEIWKEYQDNLSDDKFFQKFCFQLQMQNRFAYGDSKINRTDKAKLMELGFHEPEDHVFVGVALNTGRTIVTDDSDYGANGEPEKQEVYKYMTEELHLNILNSKQAKDVYKRQE